MSESQPPEVKRRRLDNLKGTVHSDQKCVICQQKGHMGSTTLHVMGDEKLQSLADTAERKQDYVLKNALTECMRSQCKVLYHGLCCTTYVKSADVPITTVFDKAFEKLVKEVDSDLRDQQIFKLQDLLARYIEILRKDFDTDAPEYKSGRLKTKLQSHYKKGIKFLQRKQGATDLMYSSDISVADAIQTVVSLNSHIENQNNEEVSFFEETLPEERDEDLAIDHASSIVRQQILNHKKYSPCVDISQAAVEEVVPQKLYQLISTIVCGGNNKYTNDRKQRRIWSICQDIIFTTCNCFTPKHLGIAMSVKELSASKKLITMLNHFGHSISYDQLERVDTSLAIDAMQPQKGIPPNIVSREKGGDLIQVVIDNFNLREETLDGKTPTNATSMILVQHMPDVPYRWNTSFDYVSRRALLPEEVQEVHLENKISNASKKVFCKDFYGPFLPEEKMKILEASALDQVWLASRMLPTKRYSITLEQSPASQAVPGWTGFFCHVSDVIPHPSVIGYCELLPVNPVTLDAVYTAMVTAQKMMESLKQKHTVVTMDEAIYCKARTIQLMRPKEFIDFIARMGTFHIALNLMSCIGHLFEGSGIEDVLVESGLHGHNTTRQVLQGKHYNRAIRTHKVLFEALQRLKFELYEVWSGQPDEELVDTAKQFVNSFGDNFHSTDTVDKLRFENVASTLDSRQMQVKQFVQEGNQYPTFKFWQMLINLESLLLCLIRADREGKWDLHMEVVYEMLKTVHVCDHVNYSRWLSDYWLCMKKLEDRAPEVYAAFKNGQHSVSRSTAKFSGTATDQVLEQTLNRDGKSIRGIIGKTTKKETKQKWFATAHVRSSIVRATKELSGMGDCEAAHKECCKKRMEKDEEDVQKVMKTLKIMINPFVVGDNASDDLVNIANGMVADAEVREDLTTLDILGEKARHSFIQERLLDETKGLFQSLPKQNINTFATMTKKTKKKGKDAVKIAENSEILSRLLLAMKNKRIDLKEVVSKYELSSIPLAYFTPSGDMYHTSKSQLLKQLEKYSPCQESPDINETAVLIIDAMPYIRSTLVDTTNTAVRDVCEAVFDRLLRDQARYKEIHLVFDQYKSDSIKSSERERRGCEGIDVYLASFDTPLIVQSDKFWAMDNNKRQLARHITRYICNNRSRMLAGRSIFLAGGFEDGQVVEQISNTNRRVLPDLFSTHEEADSRMFIHVKHASLCMKDVVIYTCDTDVIILAVHLFLQLGTENLFVKLKNRYYIVHEIHKHLGREVSDHLLVVHAALGCDYTSSLRGIGKGRGLAVLMEETIEGLGEVGKEWDLSQTAEKAIEELICRCYDRAAAADIGLLRYKFFAQGKKLLPPTPDSTHQHCLRAHYTVLLWKLSLDRYPNLPSPIGRGWEMLKGKPVPVKMTLPAGPENVFDLIRCHCKKQPCTGTCGCKNKEISCSDACGCMNSAACKNPYRVPDEYDCDEDSDSDDE